MDCKKNALVDDYIAGTQAERHEMLQGIRNLILETAPEAEEMVSQKMPSYKLYGKQLAYFANGKNHVSFFVDSKIVTDNAERLKDYVTCNSGFQMKIGKPLPLELMREFLELKIEMIKQGAKKK